MKKNWEDATIAELAIQSTANGKAPSDDFDDVWVQIDGLWYRPGNDGEIDSES